MHVGLRIAGTLAFILVLASPARTQTNPVFSLVEPEIALEPDTQRGRGFMVLKADRLDKGGMAKNLEDVGDLKGPSPPSVTIKVEARDLDRTDTSRRWLLTVDIDGLPRNVTQKRYLSFRLHDQQVTLSYTLSNKNTASFVWSVKGPPGELRPAPHQPVEIGIAVQGVEATQVRLLQVTLLEQSQKNPLKGGWTLCPSQHQRCTDVTINLSAHSTNRLWLYPAAETSLVGKYMGNVTIGAAEKPEGDTISLILYGTTLCHQLGGVLAILLGVACAWVSTTYIQNRLDRAQLLLPAVALRERISKLQQRLNEAPSEIEPSHFANTRNALKRLMDDLSEKELANNNYLPPRLPNPFKAMAPNVEQYKQYIAEKTARVELIDTTVKEGFAPLWKLIPSPANPAQFAEISKGAGRLDELPDLSPPPSSKELREKIQQILVEVKRALAPTPATTATDTAPPTMEQAQSYEQITAEIRMLSGISWLVYGLLATALGTYILIVLNLGFGVLGDYFLCLFWGFGLPAGGTQLVQSTVGSAATVLGFSIPKAARE
jgi:hypothetical protein